MSDYARNYDFNSKTGTTIYGSEVDAELDDILTAVNSKVDESREGAANGIAELDASTTVPPAQLPAATEVAQGAVELATTAEAVTGTDTARAVTAAGVDAVLENAAGMLGDIKDLTDAGADRILFWDDGAGAVAQLTVSTNLDITGTTLTAPTATLEAAINHDNLTGFVSNEHIDLSTVTITAGEGLSYSVGGTDLTADATLDIDLSGVSAVEGTALGATDKFLVDDSGTIKSIAVQDMGLSVSSNVGAQGDLVAADMNTIMEFTGTSGITLPLDATQDLPVGVPVVLVQKHATEILTITAPSGVTLVSVYNPGGNSGGTTDTVDSGGTAVVFKTAADTWALSGDISD